jgi:glucose-6-phosphate 1-epimerase
MIGTATRRAIQAEQQRLGWANADGRAGQRILRTLQKRPAAPPTRQPCRQHVAATSSPGLQERHRMQSIRTSAPACITARGLAGANRQRHGGHQRVRRPAAVVHAQGQPDCCGCRRARRAAHAHPGGVPVCWPWFGRQGQERRAPAHGLVRTARWELLQARQRDDGEVELTLAPPVARIAACACSMSCASAASCASS